MIRSRFVSILVLICLTLTPLSSLSAQTTEISSPDWTLLLTEYWTLKGHWETLNELILSLERDFQIARELYENSERKISDLETQLQAALIQRDRLQIQVESLEQQLVELGISLTDTRTELEQNQTDHEVEIKELVKAHEQEKVWLKWGLIGAGIVIIAEGIVIAVQSFR